MKVCLQYSLIVQKCNSHASSPICSAKLSQPSTLPTNKALFCSLNDFCFKKVDFLKAQIIIGLATIKTMHQKHITGHIHSSQGIQHNRPGVLL